MDEYSIAIEPQQSFSALGIPRPEADGTLMLAAGAMVSLGFIGDNGDLTNQEKNGQD